MLDIVADGDEGRTSRVRLRVEQLNSRHTKGILVLHGFGSAVALAVAIATVILLHKKVSLPSPICAAETPRPSSLDPPCTDRVQRVAAALQTQKSWLADRRLEDVNLVFGKHTAPPSWHCACVLPTATPAHYAADAHARIQALCARRCCSQRSSSSATACLT